MTMAVLKLKASDGTYLNYTLDKPVTTLGRSKTNDIVIDDTSISRLHVRIENRNGQYFVIDNNSSNGTYLNRRKVTTAPLQDGDTLIAGQIQFHFSHKVIGGMKTQALPLMDAAESPVRLNQTTAMSFTDLADEDQTYVGPNPTETEAPVPPPPPSGSAAPPPPVSTPAPPKVPPPHQPAYSPPPPATPPAPAFKSSPPPIAKPAGIPYQNTLDPELFDVASPFSRLLAQIIDSALVFVLMIPSVAMIFLDLPMIGAILYLLPLLASLVNFFGGWLKYGKTVGKHLMGIRIIDLDDPKKVGLSVGVLIKRIIGMFICGITMNLLYLTILFDEEGRGFHDKFANTKVVKY